MAIKIRREYIRVAFASLLSAILKTTRDQLKLKSYLWFVNSQIKQYVLILESIKLVDRDYSKREMNPINIVISIKPIL